MKAIVGVLIIGWVLVGISTAQDSCEIRVSSMSRAQLITFVQSEARAADPACLSAALRRVSELKPPANQLAATLISFLDFRRPRTKAEQAGIVSGSRDDFPAVPALVVLGSSADPVIVDFLKQSAAPDISRQNAVRTLMFIHVSDPPEVVAILARAADGSKDQVAKEQLKSAAKLAVGYCRGRWHAECEAAESSSQP